jgi:hypothetical protein
MTTLITCGTPWCELPCVQSTLETAGLTPALPASAGSVASIGVWHDRLYANQQPPSLQLQPGKPWELAASEIFLANWHQPAWGWADSRSTWLLDFWRDFDPSTRFVLLHTPAYDILAQALADTTQSEFNAQAVLDTWCDYQTEMLRFYHRNTSRCVLTHAHQALQRPTDWVGQLNTQFGTTLQSPGLAPQPRANIDPLLHLLVVQLLQSHPQVRALEDEVHATLPEGDLDTRPAAFDTLAATATLRQLYRAQAQAMKEQQQESELLLLQLHQVQEELEHHYLSGQETKTELANVQQTLKHLEAVHAQALSHRDALNHQIANLTAAHQAEAQAKAEALAHRDALTAEQSKLVADNQDIKAAGAQLGTQLAAEAQAKAEALAQRDALAAEKTSLVAARDAESRALKEQQQESELLLLQLHQVQEELEHYFLQHQQASQDKQALEARWLKLVQRYPDYAEWDHINITPDAAQLHCQIQGFKAGGRVIPLLDITVDVTGQHPTLLLAPAAQPANSPLLYWPTSAADEAPAPLHLNAAAPAGTEAAQVLGNLTPADLQLLGTACTTLAQQLPATLPQPNHWAQHLGTLQKQLATLPPVWRFDTVQLKHQQVNPDYEHLWFSLTNACYGNRHWPSFEFRLSAANVKRGKFSQHPKLEFPEPTQGNKQFDNWFEESEDDRGPKFELRFDIKNKAMDINAWQALSPTDQAQALSLCAQLPLLLQRLQTQGTAIARPWSDWLTLAQGMQHILGQWRATAPTPEPVAA